MIYPFTMLPQRYCLKWKYHNNNIQFTFSQLLEKGSFCDVTIWCGGVAFRAHRAVLASCSALLSSLLDAHEPIWGEPALVLEKTEARHLTQLLAFMYTGEVSVHHTELAGLLKTAEELQIKGLADVSWKDPKGSKPSTQQNSVNQSQNQEDPLVANQGVYNLNNHTGLWSSNENTSTPKNILNKEDVMQPISAVNGSLVVPPLLGSQNLAMLDAVKRKRGRPPLDPIDVDQQSSPKRNKIPGLNALKKSDRSSDMSGDWTDVNVSQRNEESEIAEELSSDYSEASLDGDISQFLDTTMEVEASGEVIMGEMSTTGPTGATSQNSDALKVGRESTSAMSSESGGEKKETTAIPPQFKDVIKLSDYLVRGRRPQFWAEDYVKRVMEAVFCKELEMKQAAELLGVSYGTLYGRYRDCFGCINRPYRVRDFWTEQGPSEIVAKLLKKELSLFKAAELLNVNPQTLTSYLATLSDNQAKAEKESNDGSMSPTRRSDDEEQEPKVTIRGKEDTPKDLLELFEEESDSDSEMKEDSVENNDTEVKNDVSKPAVFSQTPMIRVADIKFLKGDNNGDTENDSDNVARILKSHPDLTMIPTKRKVTFQDKEDHQQENNKTNNSNGDTSGAESAAESIS